MKNTPICHHNNQSTGGGFTLVELMTTITILGILSSVAVVSLSGDNQEQNFRTYLRKLEQDLVRIRHEATVDQAPRSIVFDASQSTYTLNTVNIATNAKSIASTQTAPEHVQIAGVLQSAAAPGTTYTVPSSSNLPVEIRFTSTMAIATGAPTSTLTNTAATIFIRTEDNKYKARIVIYQSTGYVRSYDGW